MKITRNARAGLIALLSIGLFIYLINFLKGRNIWRSGRTFYAVYSHVKGLQPGSQVWINGLRVGSVQRMVFDKSRGGDLVVQFRVDTDLDFSKNTVAQVVGSDLIGTKAIALQISWKGPAAQSGDTLKSALGDEFLAPITGLKNKLERVVVDMDSTLVGIRKLVNPKNRHHVENILIRLEETLGSYDRAAGQIGDQLSPKGELGRALGHIAALTARLSKAPLDTTLWRLDRAATSLDGILKSVDEGQGSLGLLINDGELYHNLAAASRQLEGLLRDLRLNPRRYVHFSIFGKKSNPRVPLVEQTDSTR